MKKQLVSLLIFTFILANTISSFAQDGNDGYNPNSVRGENRMIYGQPIYENDVMYRTTIWRKVNLLEKQNRPFFAVDNEISKVIIEGVKEDKLQPYYYDETPRADGVSQQMTAEAFLENLSYYDTQVAENIEVKPYDIYILEIKEDLVFDRRRSRMYWDIQSVTVTIPAGITTDNENFDKRVASFKYKDLDRYFRDIYEASKVTDTQDANGGTTEALRAHWVNPYNKKEHMCLADALEMRLFSSRITKVSNPADESINMIIEREYANEENVDQKKEVLEMSRQIEYDLMEYEHNLWEY